MLNFLETVLHSVSIHSVGNKLRDEFYQLSEKPIEMSKQSTKDIEHLMNAFYKPFSKTDIVYRLYHPNGIELNETFQLLSTFFSDNLEFHQLTEELSKKMYDVAYHPKINAGELFFCHLDNVLFEGELFEAIAIYKSNNNTPFMQINNEDGFQLKITTNAISLFDQAAIILNSEKEQGYKVLIADIKNTIDLTNWRDDFLQVVPRNDSYQQTVNLMKVTKNFINEKLDENYEVSVADKNEFLSSSLSYIKTHECLDIEDFSNEVFRNEKLERDFEDYINEASEYMEMNIPASFDISDKAIKKVQNSFKSVIRLDKNVQIHYNGKKELLERGYDNEKGMNFYKIYFETER